MYGNTNLVIADVCHGRVTVGRTDVAHQWHQSTRSPDDGHNSDDFTSHAAQQRPAASCW